MIWTCEDVTETVTSCLSLHDLHSQSNSTLSNISQYNGDREAPADSWAAPERAQDKEVAGLRVLEISSGEIQQDLCLGNISLKRSLSSRIKTTTSCSRLAPISDWKRREISRKRTILRTNLEAELGVRLTENILRNRTLFTYHQKICT